MPKLWGRFAGEWAILPAMWRAHARQERIPHDEAASGVADCGDAGHVRGLCREGTATLGRRSGQARGGYKLLPAGSNPKSDIPRPPIDQWSVERIWTAL